MQMGLQLIKRYNLCKIHFDFVSRKKTSIIYHKGVSIEPYLDNRGPLSEALTLSLICVCFGLHEI